MTAPFPAEVEQLLTESHRQVVRARATHPALTGAVELAVEDITVSWNETTAPRVAANMSVTIPDDSEMLAALDPRTGVRVEIDCGYVLPGGEEQVYTIADLGLRNRAIQRPANTVALACASDEMLAIDASPTASETVTGTSHSDAIQKLIKACISPAPRITSTVSGDAVTVDPVFDRWDTLNDIADRIGARAYDDGLRDWTITTSPVVSTPSLTLTVGENGTVLTSDESLDRDGWFNYVLLRYKWTDTASVDHEVKATAYVKTGDYAITGPAGKRIFEAQREVPTTQAQANTAAASILSRLLTRAGSYRIQSVAAYWLRPGMTVSVKLKGESDFKNHLVQSVTFRPLSGTMEIETRLASDLAEIGTTTPPPVIPTDPPPPRDPDPTPPATQTVIAEWVANASQTYQSDGSKNTFADPDILQGYYSSLNGNQRSILLFSAANSTGDEVGKTVTQFLTGVSADDISKIEVWVYFYHWYYNGGGTARFGYYNGTSIPATFSGGSPYVTQSDWPRKSGRWVNITSSALKNALVAGSCRAVLLGPGIGSDHEYYGKAYGAGSSSNKPKFRITCKKPA